MPDEEELEFLKVLVASISHMTYEDSCKLSDCPHVVSYEYDEGFWVHIESDDDSFEDMVPAILNWGLSHDLVDILIEARDLECQFVRFDSDGPLYERWPVHEW